MSLDTQMLFEFRLPRSISRKWDYLRALSFYFCGSFKRPFLGLREAQVVKSKKEEILTKRENLRIKPYFEQQKIDRAI